MSDPVLTPVSDNRPPIFQAQVPIKNFYPTKLLTTPSAVATQGDIQRQLHNLIQLNNTLKANYASQAAEINRMRQQALFHQRILTAADIPIRVAALPLAVPGNAQPKNRNAEPSQESMPPK
ncbi:MAG: hypothetical protein EXS63_00285 [Candidatus Omnitrophica bacterium]|nr:hypothetical protein [Candidatus Omnitrophota bacterium]